MAHRAVNQGELLATPLFKSFDVKAMLCVCCNKQPLCKFIQLECFHLVCKSCLSSKIEGQRVGTHFKCPECDLSCEVPTGGLDGFRYEPLQDKIGHIAAIISNNNPNRTLGVQTSGTFVSDICIMCVVNHRRCDVNQTRNIGLPNHHVFPNISLYNESIVSQMMKLKMHYCQLHNSNKLLYCSACKDQICGRCGAIYHRRHSNQIYELGSWVKDCKEEIERKVMKIDQTQRKAGMDIKWVNNILSNIEYKVQKAREAGQSSKDSGEGLETLEKEAKFHKAQVEAYCKRKNIKILQCSNAKSYVNLFLENASDAEVMDNYNAILSNLDMVSRDEGEFSLSSQSLKRDLGEDEKEAKIKKPKLDENEGAGSYKKVTPSGFEIEGSWKNACEWCSVSQCENEFLVVWNQTMKWYDIEDGRFRREMDGTDLGYVCDVEVCEGEVYVVDRDNSAVVVFDNKKGKMKRKMSLPEREKSGSEGHGLAVDMTTKDIYVSSKRANIIYRCPNQSKQFSPWATKNLNKPAYMCVTVDQHVVVSNAGSEKVIKYNPQGQVVWKHSCKGSKPRGVCIGPGGHVIVAESGKNRVVVLTSDGQMKMSFNKLEGMQEKFLAPWAVSFVRDCLIVVTNQENKRNSYVIEREFCKATKQKVVNEELVRATSKLEYDTCGFAMGEKECLFLSGSAMKWVASNGTCTREYKCVYARNATSAQVCEGEVYVSYKGSDEVIVLEMDGKIKRRMTLPKVREKLEFNLAVDKRNKDVYVASRWNHAVYKCSKESKNFTPLITEGLNQPYGVSVTPDQHVVVSNMYSHCVKIFNSQGKFVASYGQFMTGRGPHGLRFPRGVCTDPWGYIYIADFCDHRIVVLHPGGQWLTNIDVGTDVKYPVGITFGNERLIITTATQSQLPLTFGPTYGIKVKHS